MSSCRKRGLVLLVIGTGEEGEKGETVIGLSENGNNGTNNGATYSTDVPEQSCQLTSLNGCDSVAVLDLTITQPDTSLHWGCRL